MVTSNKAIQRKKGLNDRKLLSFNKAKEKSIMITKKLMALDCYKKSKTVFSYLSYKGEVDTSFFNKQARKDGKIVAFPLCSNNGKMSAEIVASEKYLVKGKYGILAPDTRFSTTLAPQNIDLIIVPCIAFCGKTKMRIGWGKGYYDKYLPKCINATKISIAYEIQHIKNVLNDYWDVPLDIIITEADEY